MDAWIKAGQDHLWWLPGVEDLPAVQAVTPSHSELPAVVRLLTADVPAAAVRTAKGLVFHRCPARTPA